jgi:hypothetical protein
MNEYTVKHGMPSVNEAIHRLNTIISSSKNREKIIKIVHGYGSTGVGGGIKEAVRQHLSNLKSQGLIQAYVPGEAFGQMMGFDSEIKTFKSLLEKDEDYKKSNPGITYIVFK